MYNLHKVFAGLTDFARVIGESHELCRVVRSFCDPKFFAGLTNFIKSLSNSTNFIKLLANSTNFVKLFANFTNFMKCFSTSTNFTKLFAASTSFVKGWFRAR